MGEVIIRADGATYSYTDSSSAAVDGVDFQVARGEMVAVLGPNGSGKTTLAKLLLGIVKPQAGSVSVFGRSTGDWSRKELARMVGVVTQREEPTFPLRVRGAVTLGRYPHLGAATALSPEDEAAVNEAMRRTDILYLENRWTQTLSGGEWQRVRLARALAQQPQLLVLDEPTANLDLKHEMEVFELAARLVRLDGITVVTVTHNVNLAARFADRVLLLDRGKVEVAGTPGQVLTSELLGKIFDWPLERFEWDGHPQFLPTRKLEMPEGHI